MNSQNIKPYFWQRIFLYRTPHHHKSVCKAKSDHAHAAKVLRLLTDQPCAGVVGQTINSKRLPDVIPHISCPEKSDVRCIQLMLPMEVLIKNPRLGHWESKTISVPSGCIESPSVNSSENEMMKKRPNKSQNKNPLTVIKKPIKKN